MKSEKRLDDTALPDLNAGGQPCGVWCSSAMSFALIMDGRRFAVDEEANLGSASGKWCPVWVARWIW